jgi:hypothetical protein
VSGIGLPQTDYSLDPPAALAGMIAEPASQLNAYETTFVANEVIYPGEFVEYLSAGVVRRPQGLTSVMNLMGVAVYRATKTASVANASGGMAPYQIGDQVTIMKRGKIYCKFSGTTPPVQTATVQVRHASDDTNTEAQYRGSVTDAAASVVAGQEKTLAGSGIRAIRAATGSTTLALIELNLP